MSMAIIGVLTMLISNPAAIFRSLFIIIGLITLLFIVRYFFLNKNSSTSNSEMKKYKQAVKQSKMKYQDPTYDYGKNAQKLRANHTKQKRKTKRPSHLRVIDGKKTKNNDRANF